MNSYESNMIDAADKVSELDACVKAILASKEIASRIMKAVVPEYKDCDIETIKSLIGEPTIGDEPVDANIPVIKTENSEDITINEGKRFYDVKFTARTPYNDEISLIINIELQNNYFVGYPLIKRAEYYAARMISSQLNTVFTGSDYQKLRKVYSIWICTTPDTAHRNTISRYSIKRENILGKYQDTEKDILDYDLISIVMLYLGDTQTKECEGIIKMLQTLFVLRMDADEKKNILSTEYGVPMTQNFNKEVAHMCDLSSLYIERGIQEGRAEGLAEGKAKGLAEGLAEGKAKGKLEGIISMMIEMYKKNLPIEMIAEIANYTPEEAKKIIAENT